MAVALTVVKYLQQDKSPKKIASQVSYREVPVEYDEIDIPCRLCTKAFSNEVAIRNHLRMEHSGEEVDLKEWVQAAMTVTKRESKEDIEIEKRKAELISSMKPVDITSLASQDVSYIIINNDDYEGKLVKIGKKKKAEAKDVGEPKKFRKEREVIPINGPFECLAPSTLVADVTCHQIFFSCCDYSIHYRDEHTRRRKATKCQVCEKVLASSIGEEATSSYPCHVCAAGFETSKELSAHVSTAHVKLKPFECSICHKRFTQQGGVQQHMRMHTGDRPFPCTFCSKSFTQKSGLDQHLRTHTKVKPYRCVICSKSFVQSIHLKQHMRTHTNVAPFKCVICEKRFKQSSHLNYHLKNHTESNMTQEQKKKYQELMGMIMNPNDVEQNVVFVQGDQTEFEDGQQIIIEQEVGDEQVVTSGEYILSDNGNDTWSIQMVDE